MRRIDTASSMKNVPLGTRKMLAVVIVVPDLGEW